MKNNGPEPAPRKTKDPYQTTSNPAPQLQKSDRSFFKQAAPTLDKIQNIKTDMMGLSTQFERFSTLLTKTDLQNQEKPADDYAFGAEATLESAKKDMGALTPQKAELVIQKTD